MSLCFKPVLSILLPFAALDGPCLSSQNLVDYHGGRVSETEREKILVHLDECERCYRRWKNAAALPSSRLENKRLPFIFLLAFVGGAVLFCLMVFVLNAQKPLPRLKFRIDQSYKDAKQQKIIPFVEEMPARDAIKVFRTSSLKDYLSQKAPHIGAFFAGIRIGWQEVYGEKLPNASNGPDIPKKFIGFDDRWQLWFYTGRFCLLLREVSARYRMDPITFQFLHDQRTVLNALNELFARGKYHEQSPEGQHILKMLGRLRTILESPTKGELSKKRVCRKVRTAINRGIRDMV